MGTTYEAWQATPHRRVAVKLVRASRFTEAAHKRFAYEAEILARLAHPCIALIHEAGMWTDADGSGVVNIEDLLIVLSEYSNCTEDCSGDLDDDGDVDIEDMLIVIGGWGSCP